MSRIVKPFGRVVSRVVVTQDDGGQLQIEGRAFVGNGAEVALDPVQICILLSQTVSSTLAAHRGAKLVTRAREERKNDGATENNNNGDV